MLSFESRECRSRVVIKIGDKNSGGGIRVEVKESGRSRVVIKIVVMELELKLKRVVVKKSKKKINHLYICGFYLRRDKTYNIHVLITYFTFFVHTHKYLIYFSNFFHATQLAGIFAYGSNRSSPYE